MKSTILENVDQKWFVVCYIASTSLHYYKPNYSEVGQKVTKKHKFTMNYYIIY